MESDMSGQGYSPQRPFSPASLAVVILLHGAALTALALSKTEVVRPFFRPTFTTFIPAPPDPPRVADPVPAPRAHGSSVKAVKPVVATVDRDPLVVTSTRDVLTLDPQPPAGPGPASADPAPPPVRTAARLDSASELQPPYPPSEQRLGREGSVKVRVRIGADGRVRAVERISAASDAFWRATERQALRYWRFTPAMEDGRPVESDTVITVTFRLDA